MPPSLPSLDPLRLDPSQHSRRPSAATAEEPPITAAVSAPATLSKGTVPDVEVKLKSYGLMLEKSIFSEQSDRLASTNLSTIADQQSSLTLQGLSLLY